MVAVRAWDDPERQATPERGPGSDGPAGRDPFGEDGPGPDGLSNREKYRCRNGTDVYDDWSLGLF